LLLSPSLLLSFLLLMIICQEKVIRKNEQAGLVEANPGGTGVPCVPGVHGTSNHIL
jgi:hypothetical protein